VKVKKVYKEQYNGLVYNFHCLPNENYFTNNVLVHNCYKSNTSAGKNMSFETFKKIIGKMPKVLCQTALGIGDIDSNPDLVGMLQYCRENAYNQVIPNLTTNGWKVSGKIADDLVKYCGSIAVSRYSPSDVCYDAVEELTGRGGKQINIHQLISSESYEDCLQLLEDVKTDKRLKKVNSIMLLMLKPCGRGSSHHKIPFEKYKSILKSAKDKNIKIGFDSCSARTFLLAIKDHETYDLNCILTEPCESDLFSSYIDVDGMLRHCSFCKDDQWKGVDVLNCDDFMKNVWFAEETKRFREKVWSEAGSEGIRKCHLFDLELKD
jgi:hypothetical protein